MIIMEQQELTSRLNLHNAWLKNHMQGFPLELKNRDLRGLDFSGHDLRLADLSGCDARTANFMLCKMPPPDKCPTMFSSDYWGSDYYGSEVVAQEIFEGVAHENG